MSEIIIAILVYMGAATSPSQITPELVEENRIAIDQIKNDPEFIHFYQEAIETESWNTLDIRDQD